jgi:hypothetical protein
MAHYFAVPAQAIEDFLASKKFERSVQREEVVYSRRSSRNPDVLIKVYTSIRVGAQQVRRSGTDAIRVCVVFDNGRRSFGIGRFAPVFRVTSAESTLRRLEERLREAAERGNEWIDNEAIRQQERVQERRGFMSDPDYRAFRDVEPCSEPPDFLPGM